MSRQWWCSATYPKAGSGELFCQVGYSAMPAKSVYDGTPESMEVQAAECFLTLSSLHGLLGEGFANLVTQWMAGETYHAGCCLCGKWQSFGAMWDGGSKRHLQRMRN